MIQHKNHWDVIIIGAGILGTFHAMFALQKGLNVLLLEKDLRPSEATVRNFGQIIPSGMSEDEWFENGRQSLDTYQSIQKEFDITVRQNGSVYLASTKEELALLQEKAERYKTLDYNSIQLSKSQCHEKYPSLKSEYCIGGLFFPQEISIEPATLIHRLHEYLIAKYDLDYRPSTPVKDCHVTDNWAEVIDARGNKYRGEKIIICNGRDFKFLLPDLFFKSELEIVKLQMLSTYPMPEIKLQGSLISGLSIRRYSAFKNCSSYSSLKPSDVSPEITKYGIHILFKQSSDGSIIIGESHEYADVSTSDTLDYGSNDQLNDLILNEAKKIIDLPSWQINRRWNGFFCQAKGNEIFQHQIDHRIHILTGLGANGMTTSSGLAKKSIDKIFSS